VDSWSPPFSEGVFVGYRRFDPPKMELRFLFGFSLSYAEFEYSGLRVERTKDDGLDGSVRPHNSDAVASDEVPQVYLDVPKKTGGHSAPFAVRAWPRLVASFGSPATQTTTVSKRRYHGHEKSSRCTIEAHGQWCRSCFWQPVSGSVELRAGARAAHAVPAGLSTAGYDLYRR